MLISVANDESGFDEENDMELSSDSGLVVSIYIGAEIAVNRGVTTAQFQLSLEVITSNRIIMRLAAKSYRTYSIILLICLEY